MSQQLLEMILLGHEGFNSGDLSRPKLNLADDVEWGTTGTWPGIDPTSSTFCVKIDPHAGPNSTQMDRIAHFGRPGPMRDRLIDAVLRGEKTATTSLLADLEANQEELPTVGERLTVIDSEDRPVAVIELLKVEVIRLGEADRSLARDEGEGFKTVSEWRSAHERFWRKEAPETLLEPLSDDTRIVVERFRLVDLA
jgi:uncharacterized protein YhfF